MSFWNEGGNLIMDDVAPSGFDGHLNHLWLKDGAVVEADEATKATFTAAKEAQHKLMQAYAALQTAGEYADVSTLSQQKTKFLEAKALYQKGDYAACIAAVDAFYGTIPTFD